MKNTFVLTQNVRKFIDAMNSITGRNKNIPGMGLIYGEPGLGKTRTSLWWALANNGRFIRIKKLMTGRWLLEEIITELGEQPAYKTADLYRQIVDILNRNPTPLFIDEIDYLTDRNTIETLRDIHDTTANPIIFIGMDTADKKFARYKHLYDRFSEILRFTELSLEDIQKILRELSDYEVSDDAIQYIAEQKPRFRKIISSLYIAEQIAKRTNLKKITAEVLKKGVNL